MIRTFNQINIHYYLKLRIPIILQDNKMDLGMFLDIAENNIIKFENNDI